MVNFEEFVNYDNVTPSLAGQPFDPANTEQHTALWISTRIAIWIVQSKSKQERDYLLWNAFRDGFENWTEALFTLASTALLRKLRYYLTSNGLWVKKPSRKSYARVFADLLSAAEYPEWTTDNIDDYLRTIGPINSRFVQGSINPLPPAPATVSPITALLVTSVPPITPATPAVNQQESATPVPSEVPDNRFVHFTATPYPAKAISTLTEYERSNVSKSLRRLMKILSDKERKYSGEMYDILENKLRVFYDCCTIVGLSTEYFHLGFSIMLRDRALDFYYDKISGRSYDFRTMVDMMKAHFETEERRQYCLSKWREITYSFVRWENPKKSELECMDILFDRLRTLQKVLPVEYQNEFSLREQMLNACRGVPECNLALYKPGRTNRCQHQHLYM